MYCCFFFFQAEDGIRDAQESRGLGDVYKRQVKQYRVDDPAFTRLRRSQITNCVLQHLHSNQTPFDRAHVALAAPFVVVFDQESDIYHCFQRLMERVYSPSRTATDDMNTRGSELARFIMLLRSLHPDLSNHFEEEELEPEEWALPWLQHLLTAELPVQCVLRLWDTYFAIQDGRVIPGDTLGNFHPYVCLAILSELEEILMETEHPELKGVLLQLPDLQMDRIITQAFDLREMAIVSGLELLEEGPEEVTFSLQQLPPVPRQSSSSISSASSAVPEQNLLMPVSRQNSTTAIHEFR
eukprot:TRINITY_DN12885_c0_g1_i1.p1 TRINITY_DN12885_c0_g1~~TRINITY_DN12885_c0_g1_i1.p1  ORF type:complete len:297 (+),score=75.92 TRINITY_DN12885_c0_g1_i1:105-995(+)